MDLKGINIGLGITGSFCTFSIIEPEVEKMVSLGANVFPIFSFNAQSLDTKFGKAKDWVARFEAITGNKSILTIPEAEPIGPSGKFDVMVVAPCTPNPLNIQKIKPLA